MKNAPRIPGGGVCSFEMKRGKTLPVCIDKDTANGLEFKERAAGRHQRFYLIPLNLALLVYRERMFTEFSVWLLLKHRTDGKLRMTTKAVNAFALSLSISPRTVYRAVKRLRERYWLGYNPKSELTYIRGLDTVRIIEGLPNRIAVRFDMERLDEAKAFICACAVGCLIRVQKAKAWQARAGANTKGVATQPAPLPAYYPVACTVLERFFDVSRGTAQQTKNLAAKAKYIEVTHISTALPGIEPQTLLIGFPELKGRIFKKNGVWFERQTDRIKSTLQFRRRNRLPIVLESIDNK